MTDDVNFKPGTSARVIKDSISPSGIRLTTMEWTFHRFILAEVNTHRVLSRNSASSRAIPLRKQLDRVTNNIAMPVEWRAEQRGMQGGDLLPEKTTEAAELAWEMARNQATKYARMLGELGVHKSIVNRLLEPFMWHTAIITATDWDGVWHQRCHRDAQHEFQKVARLAKDAYDASEPEEVGPDGWHLPYIDADDHAAAHDLEAAQTDGVTATELLRRVSTARCARVSYLTHDGRRSLEDDLTLYERLTANLSNGTDDPWHASPLEHVATPAIDDETPRGNFTGWHQYRHMVEDGVMI